MMASPRCEPAKARPAKEPAEVAELDGELERLERELTAEVPNLLETMNRTSEEVNLFERHLGEAQARYRTLLEQWSRLYEDLRARHGATIDRVKPYFDAAQVLNAASHRVQGVVREFSAASSQHLRAKDELRQMERDLEFGAHQVQLELDQQDGLSRATVRVLKCQQERDGREQEYAVALREYQDAQEALENWKAQIGESVIRRTLPCFKQLQQHQLTLASEQNRINAFTERGIAAKTRYSNVLKELDRINVAVHTARKSSAKRAAAEVDSSGKLAPEEVPELVPEDTACKGMQPEGPECEVLQADDAKPQHGVGAAPPEAAEGASAEADAGGA